MIIETIIFIAVISVVGYIILMKKWYPVKVMLFEKRAGGYTIRFDRAGRLGKKGQIFYRLKKLKKNTKPSAYDYIMQTGKGLFLMLWSPGPDEFYPMKISEKNPSGTELDVLDEDMKFWYAQNIKMAYERAQKKGFIEVYWPVISVMIVVLSILLIIFSMPEYTKLAMSPINDAARNIMSAKEALSGSATLTAP